MVVQVIAEDQSLRWYGRPPKISTGSIGFVVFQFRLCGEWENLVVVAQFTQEKTYNCLLANGACFMPMELTEGLCTVSLFGYSDQAVQRGTTAPIVFDICRSGFVSSAETPIPPTPDLYAQLLEKINETAAGNLGEEAVAKAIETYLAKNPVAQFKTDETLELKNGVLSVNTTDSMGQDNTLPITSAGVHAVVGNIGAVLDVI